MLKVHSGLIGISNNANTRQQFYLAAPNMTCISAEFKQQFGISIDKPQEHLDMQPDPIRQENYAIDKIKACTHSHSNPFAVEGDQLYNFITHVNVPQKYVLHILNIGENRQKLYETYVAEHIDKDVSLWAPVQKQTNIMYMSGNRKQSVKIHNQMVELNETKDIYSRFMVLARSSRDIDLKM